MGGGGGNEASYARREEQERQARIREGTGRINTTFDGQFTPGYFDNLRTKFMDYALPQLRDQYGKAGGELQFAMARGGIGDSSITSQKQSELDKLNALRAREIADQGLGYSTKAKTGVEDARSNLIATLNATGDAQQAATSAITRANVLSEPPQYSPLTQLFSDFTSTLGYQAALERAGAMGSPIKPRYNTGIFGGGGSVRVT